MFHSEQSQTMTKEASGIPVHCAHDELADIANLIPNPRNPNKHGDKQVAMLAKIIRHQGWRAPIVVSNRSGFVVAGHGRLEAAKLLGVQSVPVNRQDFATEADEWAHLIADNRIAELAEIDSAAIAAILREVDGQIDAFLLGFGLNEVAEMLRTTPRPVSRESLSDAEQKTGDRQIAGDSFAGEMADKSTVGLLPIVPLYAEHHEAFIICCDNTIDEAWIRNKLGLEDVRKSYKDGSTQRSNIVSVEQLREVLK